MKTHTLVFLILFFSIQVKSQSLVGTYTRQQLKSNGERIPEQGMIPELFSYVYSKNKSIQKLTTV